MGFSLKPRKTAPSAPIPAQADGARDEPSPASKAAPPPSVRGSAEGALEPEDGSSDDEVAAGKARNRLSIVFPG